MPNCNVCSSTNLIGVSQQRGYSVYRCSVCGFCFADCAEKQLSSLSTNYNESYFDPFISRDLAPSWQALYQGTLSEMEASALGRKLLDTGCGTSYFGIVAKAQGWDVSVIDGSAYAVEYLSREFGMKGAVADLNQGNAIRDAFGDCIQFDVINSFHVIEHLSQPRDYLIGCHEALRPQGLLRLAFPFCSRFRVSVHQAAYCIGLANHPYNFGLPDHVSYFNKRSIIRLLKEVGFSVLSVRYDGYKTFDDLVSLEQAIDLEVPSGEWSMLENLCFRESATIDIWILWR